MKDSLMQMLGALSAISSVSLKELNDVIEEYRPEYEEIRLQEKRLANKMMKRIQDLVDKKQNSVQEEPEDDGLKLRYEGKSGVQLYEPKEGQFVIKNGTAHDLAEAIATDMQSDDEEVYNNAFRLHVEIMQRGLV